MKEELTKEMNEPQKVGKQIRSLTITQEKYWLEGLQTQTVIDNKKPTHSLLEKAGFLLRITVCNQQPELTNLFSL